MFNNDFFELKKALETVTLEVTDLKNQLHKKDLEIEQLRQNLRNSNTEDYREKAIQLDVNNKELLIENSQLKQKIIHLKGEIQELQQFPIKHTTKKLSQRLKVETTMLEPIKSIFISNGIDRISNSFVKSLDCSSFSRTNNFF